MCALLPSTSRAQAYVFMTDRAKIRPLLHAARYRTTPATLNAKHKQNNAPLNERGKLLPRADAKTAHIHRHRVSRWLLSDVQAYRRLTAHPPEYSPWRRDFRKVDSR
jgi:ribosomal protein L19E